MKTITLTDEAYERLLAWKKTPRESFSKVVMEHVPARGTMEQILHDIAKLPPLTSDQFKVMEDAASWGRKSSGFRDKWNS